MTMVERVARAIHEKALETRDVHRMPDWIAVARVAIEAMQEPDPSLAQEFVDAMRARDGYDGALDAYRAMIAAVIANITYPQKEPG